MQEMTYSAEQIGLAARLADAEAKLPADKKAKFLETMNAVLLGIELGSQQAPERPQGTQM